MGKIHAIGRPQDFATNERCEALRVFLLSYAAEHDGQTPTIDLMGREIGAPPPAVQFMIGRLERAGLIHIISRSPLRIMVKTDANEKVPDSFHDPERYKRYLDAEGTRHQLGRFIGEMEAKQGRGPTLREMMSHLGMENTGWVHRAAEMLASKQLIQFGNGVPTRLTPFGRQFYGFNGEKKMTDQTDKPDIVLVPVKKTRAKGTIIAEEIGRCVFDWSGLKPPKQSEICKAIHRSTSTVSNVIADMVAAGWVEPFVRNTKQGIKLTDAGRERFCTKTSQDIDQQPEVTSTPDRAFDALYEPEKGPSDDITDQVVEAYRRTQAPPAGRAELGLGEIDTVDLIIELGRRGYRAERN
jgi:Mn-dependent DtxR family transcriptional regulator